MSPNSVRSAGRTVIQMINHNASQSVTDSATESIVQIVPPELKQSIQSRQSTSVSNLGNFCGLGRTRVRGRPISTHESSAHVPNIHSQNNRGRPAVTREPRIYQECAAGQPSASVRNTNAQLQNLRGRVIETERDTCEPSARDRQNLRATIRNVTGICEW